MLHQPERFIALATLLAAGCIEQPVAEKNIRVNRGTIQGIVRDAEGGERLSRIQVSAFFDKKWNTTLTLDDDPQTRFSEAGSYAIGNVPVEAAIPVSFAGSAMVQGEERVYSEWSTQVTIVGLITGAAAQTQPVSSEDPIATQNASLVQRNAILRGRIFSTDGGGEFRDRGVNFVVDFLAQGFQDVPRVWGVNTDGEGRFAIGTEEAKLPRAVLAAGNLYVLPLDIDGNGVPEYGTWVSSTAINLTQFGRNAEGSEDVLINLRSSAACNPLNLSPPPESLCSDPGRPVPSVVWSTVEPGALFRAIPYTTSQNPIAIVFNIPMDASLEANIDAGSATDPPSPLVTLRGNAGQGDPVAVNLKLENGVKLLVTTSLDLAPGGRYVLAISANARSTLGTTLGGTGFTLNLRPVKSNQPDAPAVTGVTLDSDVGSPTRTESDVDWNSATVQILWKSLADVSGYAVFARDTKRNADWTDITPSANNVRSRGEFVVATLSLAAFDVTPNDDADLDGTVGEAVDDATPFSEGNQIFVSVVGRNRDGLPSAPNPDTARKFIDKKPPTCSLCALSGSPAACSADLDSASGNQPAINAAGQNDSGQNTTATDKKIYLRVRCSEFMDTKVSPTLTLTDEGQTGCSDIGTAASNTTVPGQSTFVWVNGREGHFELTVAGSANESGDCFQIAWDGVKDSSGNLENTGSPQDQLTGDLR